MTTVSSSPSPFAPDSALPSGWRLSSISPLDVPPLADFLAITPGLGGRKFPATNRDVAEVVSGTVPGEAKVLRDRAGVVRGYRLLFPSHGEAGDSTGDVQVDATVPGTVARVLVADLLDSFTVLAAAPGGPVFVRVIASDRQGDIVAGLLERGAGVEARFVGFRRDLSDIADPSSRPAQPGYRTLNWAEVIEAGLGEKVRRLQYDTFLEHFGELSKSVQAWERHLVGRSFSPDFSFATILAPDPDTAVTADADVVGYALGSVYTDNVDGVVDVSAHTDYLGVDRAFRKRGIAEHLLQEVWAAARRRGLGAASLGSDVENRSNAYRLYERLGYVVVDRQASYRIEAGALSTAR